MKAFTTLTTGCGQYPLGVAERFILAAAESRGVTSSRQQIRLYDSYRALLLASRDSAC